VGIIRPFLMPILSFLEMVKFEHTVFALPFAYMGMFLAQRGIPPLRTFLLITLAFASARTYAMTLNRLMDLPFDKRNPRTKGRALVVGRLSIRGALIFVFASLSLLVLSAWALNPLCLKLLPIALFFLSFYHLTKRFTYLSHFFLGFTDGLAPCGSWIAIRSSAFSVADIPMWLLVSIVTVWIAGFDILYQCQDVEFDRREGLFSIPAKFGIPLALKVARLCHFSMVVLLFCLGYFLSFSLPFVFSLLVAILLLVKEHSILSPFDPSRLDVAFFNMNGYISVVVCLGMVSSIFMG